MKVFFPVHWDEKFTAHVAQAYNLTPDHATMYVIVHAEHHLINEALENRIKAICIGYPHQSGQMPKQIDFKVILTDQPLWKVISEEYSTADLIIWIYRSFQPIVERFISTPDITPMFEHIRGTYLIAGSPDPDLDMQEFAFATNFSKGTDKAIEIVRGWQRVLHKDPAHPLTFRIFSVASGSDIPDPITLSELKYKYTDADRIDFVQHESVLEGVINYLEEHEIDVLGLYLPHRNILGKLAHYHLTRDLIHKTDIPMLLVVE